MMNSGAKDQEWASTGAGAGRYFGRDITNLESAQGAARDGSQPLKSTLRTSGRDLRAKPSIKPTPLQFYKEILKNQRLLHKRSATNDTDSCSADGRDAGKHGRPPLAADNEANARQRLNNFLKVKSKTGTWLAPEQNQDNQIVIQEFDGEKTSGAIIGFKSGKETKLQNFSEKFASIPSLGPAVLQQSRVTGVSKQTPTNNMNNAKFQNSDLHKPEKAKVDRSSKNFQHLRLNLEDQRASPRRDARERTAEPKSEQKEAIENELDKISTRSVRTSLRRQFDIPFMWEYLLVQEVATSLP
jgi:hypothetical protein